MRVIDKVNYLARDVVVPRWRVKFEVGQGCLSEQLGPHEIGETFDTKNDVQSTMTGGARSKESVLDLRVC